MLMNMSGLLGAHGIELAGLGRAWAKIRDPLSGQGQA